MVCTENLCRSPVAEGLLRAHLKRLGINDVRVDSAGTREDPNVKRATLWSRFVICAESSDRFSMKFPVTDTVKTATRGICLGSETRAGNV